jgi:hypothetical protein
MAAALVDRQEALAAYDRLWSDGSEPGLVFWGEPGCGVSTLVRHLWRAEQRNKAILYMDGFPLRREFVLQALAGQLISESAARPAPPGVTQEMRTGRRAQITASPIVAVSVGHAGQDLVAALSESLTGEAVAFFDGCDRLAADPEFLRWFAGFLLPQLAACVEGLRVVVGGDAGQIGDHGMERVWLRPWTHEQSASFLRDKGVLADSESAGLAAVANGHPFVLALIAHEFAATGDAPAIPHGDARGAWLFGRLLDPLDQDVRSLAELALSLRWFSLERLRAIGHDEITARSYQKLIALSWIQPTPAGLWRAHPALRFLYARWCIREEPGRWRKLHQTALDDDACSPADECYHRHFVTPDESARLWAAAWDSMPEHRSELDDLTRLPEIRLTWGKDFARAWQARAAAAAPRSLSSVIQQNTTQPGSKQNTKQPDVGREPRQEER